MEIKYDKVVGVLGGMGPYATAAFFQKVLDMTEAKKDWDHVRMIIDDNPHIPSRTRHLLYDEASPVEGMIASCQKLAAYPVDFIAIPCNSACYFIEQLRPHVAVPILNIIEVGAQKLIKMAPRSKRCLVLGGFVTYTKQTYQPYLAAGGVEYIHHSPEEQRAIEAVIEKIKLSNDLKVAESEAEELLAGLVERYEADSLIFGCTEFGCISFENLAIPIVDSSEALAEAILQHAKKSENE